MSDPRSTGALDRLLIHRSFPASPEAIWAAWTTAAGLQQWWWNTWPDSRYEIDARLGGSYLISAANHGIAIRGDYLVFEPTNRLVFTWIWIDGDGEGPTEQVEVTLTPVGATTDLTVLHTGPWTTAEPTDNYRLGWDSVLSSLSKHFSG